MKRFTTLFTILVFATAILGARASSPQLDGGHAVATSRADGRRLVWSDEFDGNTLDPAKWQVWGTMSSTDNIYTNDERTMQVAEGLLRLRVLPSEVPDKLAMLPRGLVTRDRMAFRYGYLEMRAKVPYRRGAWPSFWLQSAPPPLRKADWMSEIDVLESFASPNAAVANLHKWRGKDHVMLPGGEGSPKRAYLFPNPETLNDEFHIYAMEWTPEAISFLVDGERFMTVPIDEANDFAPSPSPAWRASTTRTTSSSTTRSSPPATAGVRRTSAFSLPTRSPSTTKSTGYAFGRKTGRSCFDKGMTRR